MSLLLAPAIEMFHCVTSEKEPGYSCSS